MVCLDTDLLIDFLKGRTEATEAVSLHKEKGPLRTTIINEYELLKGVSMEKWKGNRELAKNALSTMDVLSFDEEACEIASGLFGELSANGSKVNEFDLLVAAITIRHGETLVTRDEHFGRIPRLRLKRW